jgi:hypothetical protein
MHQKKGVFLAFLYQPQTSKYHSYHHTYIIFLLMYKTDKKEVIRYDEN